MNTTTQMPVNDRNKVANQNRVADGLSRVLAETNTLYLKTHNFHWNVTGPMFQPLHSVFEEQYSQLAEAADEIAERIRAIGHPAPGSFAEFQTLSSIKEASGKTKALEMVKELLEGHETISQTANTVVAIAQEYGDEGTADLMIQRIQEHDKTAWMLRSFLEN
ncbi:MAG: DNA starvation/stationary phase protection protein [Nitrospina sp.]|jgi:starvation-inducible DNA-binding protein|nr:DNA starvation/stationary phase protection protein [Nitrospina sp.]MBT3511243.1 DNA starvation/stationary phase protection protein [Nitrospina sp.]MBT3875629.1 DNA starvation/stationary phase protection protein [Nitrospina sp.]MBT4047533.1 DNA starvation/stationary phase protection protein [Nitrospina sp.]MBT4558110.1 DNA starvation/stationary phase protection protein [Nitrospina sp.]